MGKRGQENRGIHVRLASNKKGEKHGSRRCWSRKAKEEEEDEDVRRTISSHYPQIQASTHDHQQHDSSNPHSVWTRT